MPELPEVETTRSGIAAHVINKTIKHVDVRNRHLRWPVMKSLDKKLEGQVIHDISRRGKYLIFHFDNGYMLLHLGMSGSLRILTGNQPATKHDHVDLIFAGGICLRFRDPRRFGSIHWTDNDPEKHPLLCHLGPEPLSETLNGEYLYKKSRGRKQSIKTFLMDSRIVVGVGNIYASESLFAAGIHPKRKAGNISHARYIKLAAAIKQVLQRAVAKGGTTLRDFVNGKGEPGFFRHELQVYDRSGLPCYTCKTPIKSLRLGQRSSYYCSVCQH